MFLWSRGVVPSKSDDIHVGSTCDTRHLDREREMVSEKYMRKVGAKRKGVSTICALKKGRVIVMRESSDLTKRTSRPMPYVP